jgi:hypothetical protein
MNATSTGNTSLISRVTMYKAMPKAESVRVLEHHAVAYNFGDKTITDEFNRELLGNFGVACVPYMQYCIRKKDEVRDLFFSVQERIDKAAGLVQPHRFWSAQTASAISGLLIAKQLKLINYDMPAIFKWVITLLESNKASYSASNDDAESILTSYLAENYNNILRIKSTEDARTPDTSDVFIVPDSTPRFQLVARYEYDVKRLFLMPKPLREWCNKLQLTYHDLISSLKTGPTKATVKKIRMGKGTRMNLPPIDALVLDCSKFMSEEREEELATIHSRKM